ncbi:MAG: cadherin repeat domain-containing protein, partial [Planctomycetota bacterium]
FTIDASSGEITTTGSLDFESGSSHTVRVVATDDGGLSSEAELSISVGDVNDAPDAVMFTGGRVAENAGPGTVVAVASASDSDAGDGIRYSLSDDAGGRFTIDASSGEITTTGSLDFESGSSHTVRVVATDDGGLSSEAELSISVGDVNDAPDAVMFTGGRVAENAGPGTVVAVASASDSDAGDGIRYSLSDDAGGRFTIDASSGEITTTGSLDFESGSSHTVRVVAT